MKHEPIEQGQPVVSGIFDFEADAYHRDPCPEPSLSSTLAKAMINSSPMHAWLKSPKLNPMWQPENKKAFDIGRAAHRVNLGAGDEYVEIPSDLLASNGAATTKAAKEFIAAAREAGQTPLKSEEIRDIEYMAEVADRHYRAIGMPIDSAASERAAVSQVDGIWMRCMVDNAPFDPAAPLRDLKTTTDAHPQACQKAIVNFGYDIQQPHYTETWHAASGEERERDFLFHFQEKEAPFLMTTVRLDEEALEIGRRKARRAREIWAWCLAHDQWPGYPVGIHTVGMPNWAAERWFERESIEQDYRDRTGRDFLEQSIIR